VRLEASYDIRSEDGALVLRVSGPAGETAARVFAGFCAVRFGEEGYAVERRGLRRTRNSSNGAGT